MSHFYSAFGLIFHSNVPVFGLAELPPQATAYAIDVEVRLGLSPPDFQTPPINAGEVIYASAETNASGEPLVRIFRASPGELFRIEFDEGVQSWLDARGRHVWSVWQAPLTLDDALSYLLGPVFGFLLRLRGVVCLHASAVSIAGRAVAFLGPSGAGKSTIAAAFAARRIAAIADDIVSLIERDNSFHALSAYPYLSLWPDSVDAVLGDARAARPVSVNWEKKRLPLGSSDLPFESRSLPLGGVFILGERRDGADSSIMPVPPREALLTLIPNSYATNALDSKSHADEFGFLGRLVVAVPVWSLHVPSDQTRLPDVCEAIMSRIASRTPPESVGPAALTDAAIAGSRPSRYGER